MTAKQIKALRKKNDLKQKELASYCGVSVRTVQGWEQGKAPNGSARLLLNQLSK